MCDYFNKLFLQHIKYALGYVNFHYYLWKIPQLYLEVTWDGISKNAGSFQELRPGESVEVGEEVVSFISC